MAWQPPNPLEALASAWNQACANAAGLAQQVTSEFDARARQLHRHSAHFAGELQQLSQRRVRHQPLFAAIASGSRRKLPRPIGELAEETQDIKARLQNIHVYTVTNSQNELVLLSGEGEQRRLGILFFSESDAHALVQKIKEDEPRLGKQTRVLQVPISELYTLASNSSEATGSNEVIFRFMPDAAEVASALALTKAAGLGNTAFHGVPVFQAESLCVRTPRARYTPLFFSKTDLDRAVKNAFQQREGQKEADAQAKFKGASDDLAAARATASSKESKLAMAAVIMSTLHAAYSRAGVCRSHSNLLELATEGEPRKQAQRDVDEASSRAAKFSKQLEGLRAGSLPKIEVGSLEEVMSKMENDTQGDWNSVMFVPSGSVELAPPISDEQQAPAEPLPKDPKK